MSEGISEMHLNFPPGEIRQVETPHSSKEGNHNQK